MYGHKSLFLETCDVMTWHRAVFFVGIGFAPGSNSTRSHFSLLGIVLLSRPRNDWCYCSHLTQGLSTATKRFCSRWGMGTAARSRWRSRGARRGGGLCTARADTGQPLVLGMIYTSRTTATQTPCPTHCSATLTSSPRATSWTLHRPSPSWRGRTTSNVMTTRCLCSSSLVRPAPSFPTKCTFPERQSQIDK